MNCGTCRSPRHELIGAPGFAHNGELFVMGRLADRIALGDASYFPHHIEGVVNFAGDFRKGNTTAWAGTTSQGGEALHIAVELRSSTASAARGTAEAVAARVRQRFTIDHAIVVHFMPPRSAVRTTSGKLVRRGTAAGIASGAIKAQSFTIPRSRAAQPA